MNNQEQKSNVVTENKGRGLFYGVIAIATFIIMAVGATFAYFTATTESMNSAVTTGSTTLQLKYISYGAAWSKNDLIPADTAIVEYSVENQSDATNSSAAIEGVYPVNGNNTICKDDYGNSICSIYVFQVENTAASPQSVSLNIVSEVNGFASLNAMAYTISVPTDSTALTTYETIYKAGDETLKLEKNGINDPVFATGTDDPEGAIKVTDGEGTQLTGNQYSPVYINRNGVVKTLLQWVESRDTSTGATVKKPAIDRALVQITEANQFEPATARTAKIADDIEIKGGATTTFALVLYIKNADEDQTKTDALKTFSGQVVVSSGDGSTGVSGTIGLANQTAQDNLQSNQQNSENTTSQGTESVTDPDAGDDQAGTE